MEIKLSHTSMNKYLECPKSYELHYRKKLRSNKLPSALLFGKAFDSALNEILTNYKNTNPEELKNNAVAVFNAEWESQKDNQNNNVSLKYNPNVEWNRSDYDGDLLEKSDWSEVFKMSKEPFEEKDTNPALNSLMNWLSLKRKAKFLLEAYVDQVLPQIDEVYLVQKDFKIDDGTNGILSGFIDVILRLKDGRDVVLDNKTSSMEYAEDSVRESVQLSIYKKVLEIMKDEGTYTGPIPEYAGYAVLSKKLNKKVTKTCKSCGYELYEGSKMKKCDATTEEGERCNGELDKKKEFSVNTSLIVDKIPESMVQLVLENVDEIKTCIEKELFPKNLNSCINKFGKKCVYFDYCRTKDMTNLEDMTNNG